MGRREALKWERGYGGCLYAGVGGALYFVDSWVEGAAYSVLFRSPLVGVLRAIGGGIAGLFLFW